MLQVIQTRTTNLIVALLHKSTSRFLEICKVLQISQLISLSIRWFYRIKTLLHNILQVVRIMVSHKTGL